MKGHFSCLRLSAENISYYYFILPKRNNSINVNTVLLLGVLRNSTPKFLRPKLNLSIISLTHTNILANFLSFCFLCIQICNTWIMLYMQFQILIFPLHIVSWAFYHIIKHSYKALHIMAAYYYIIALQFLTNADLRSPIIAWFTAWPRLFLGFLNCLGGWCRLKAFTKQRTLPGKSSCHKCGWISSSV